jgi:signal transduction histidine kinase
MSKIEAGKLELEETEFDLVSVVEEVVDMFAVFGCTKRYRSSA